MPQIPLSFLGNLFIFIKEKSLYFKLSKILNFVFFFFFYGILFYGGVNSVDLNYKPIKSICQRMLGYKFNHSLPAAAFALSPTHHSVIIVSFPGAIDIQRWNRIRWFSEAP